MTKMNVRYKAVSGDDDFERNATIEVDLPELDTSRYPPKTDLKKVMEAHQDAILSKVREAVNNQLPANWELSSVEHFEKVE